MSLFARATTLKRLDATVGFVLCKLLGHARHALGRPELAPDPDPRAVRRILLIRPGGMGDMLMLLPIIRSIQSARPDITCDIVCEKRNHAVLELAGLGDHAILYDAHPWRMLRLNRNRYDAVLDTEQFHNFSAIMAWRSGAPVRVGFRINPARLSLYTHLVSYDVDGYELDQFARLLRPLRIPLAVPDLHGILRDAAPALAAQLPKSVAPLAQAGPIVAISPGSSDRYKQWGVDKFAEVIRGLESRGWGIVLVGGPDESAQAAELLRRAASPRILSCVGSLSLPQTAAVLQAAQLFIGGDSGLAHLAVALARPTLTLFGPSDERKWSRTTPEHRVLRRSLPCSPCSIFGYHKLCRDIPCMAGITPADVLAAVTPIGAQTGSPRR